MATLEEKIEMFENELSKINKKLDEQEEGNFNSRKAEFIVKEETLICKFYQFDKERLVHCPDCESTVFRTYRMRNSWAEGGVFEQICAVCNYRLGGFGELTEYKVEKTVNPETGEDMWLIPIEHLQGFSGNPPL